MRDPKQENGYQVSLGKLGNLYAKLWAGGAYFGTVTGSNVNLEPDNPRRVDPEPIVINGVRYDCSFWVDYPENDPACDTGGATWKTSAVPVLQRHNSIMEPGTDAARRAFRETILPTALEWLRENRSARHTEAARALTESAVRADKEAAELNAQSVEKHNEAKNMREQATSLLATAFAESKE